MIQSNKSIKNVSVDPLVVLLDASLNGELEQVMKFTKLVSKHVHNSEFEWLLISKLVSLVLQYTNMNYFNEILTRV